MKHLKYTAVGAFVVFLGGYIPVRLAWAWLLSIGMRHPVGPTEHFLFAVIAVLAAMSAVAFLAIIFKALHTIGRAIYGR